MRIPINLFTVREKINLQADLNQKKKQTKQMWPYAIKTACLLVKLYFLFPQRLRQNYNNKTPTERKITEGSILFPLCITLSPHQLIISLTFLT